jgi:hypothetical protein
MAATGRNNIKSVGRGCGGFEKQKRHGYGNRNYKGF